MSLNRGDMYFYDNGDIVYLNNRGIDNLLVIVSYRNIEYMIHRVDLPERYFNGTHILYNLDNCPYDEDYLPFLTKTDYSIIITNIE